MVFHPVLLEVTPSIHPVQATGDEEAFFKLHPKATGAAVTEFLVFQAENPNSLFSSICEGDLTKGLSQALATFDAACRNFPPATK